MLSISKTTADVMPYKCGKLMGNPRNAVGTVTNGDRESTQPIYNAVIQEAQSIVQKAGIKWIPQGQVSRDWPETTSRQASIPLPG